MLFGGFPQRAYPLTLYTEQLIVRGSLETRASRVTDMLNGADEPHLVLEDVTFEEYGSGDPPGRAEFAQVNLSSVLFAVSLQPVGPASGLRTPKIAERAFVSVPPFRVLGYIHLLPDRDLRRSLAELKAAFIPVTDAVFWSDSIGEPRRSAALVAINQARAQILAPFRAPDRSAGPGEEPDGPGAEGDTTDEDPAEG